MEKEQASYRQILKSTSILGGVQIFNILIQILRSKIIAVLLGASGYGVMGLLTSTTGLITSLTNFGLGTSAVRNVSVAYAQEDKIQLNLIIAILRKFVFFTGLLGSVVTLVFAPWLSQITFGNKDYTISFLLLSVTLLLAQLSVGQNVLLQGTRHIKYLAKASAIGALLGLIISMPLYYLFRLNGIVPAIIVSAIITLYLSWHFANKVEISAIKISFKEAFIQGRSMFVMGFMLSLALIVSQITSYVLKIYIGNIGSLEQVGLYTAGFAIINNYVGMVFSAMATEYYPRLSAIAHDSSLTTRLMNQQGEITLLILSPILTLFVVFINWGIVLLYSEQFIEINMMLRWATLGVLFKGASFAIAHIFLAKGASKLFFLNETTACVYILVLNVIFYKHFGLSGIGMSFLIGYFLYFIQVYYVARVKYKYSIGKDFLEILCIHFILNLACFVAIVYIPSPFNYFVIAIFGCTVIYLSWIGLNERMNLMGMIRNYLKY